MGESHLKRKRKMRKTDKCNQLPILSHALFTASIFKLIQRQSLRVIPMTRIDIRSEEFESPAFVVGVNNKVVLKSKDGENEDGKKGKWFSFLRR